MADQTLNTRWTGDTKDLERASDRARGEMGKVEKGFGQAAGGVAKAGLAIGGALVVDQVVSFASASLGMATDLAESMSKVETVFGDSADEMASFIENANKLNLSDSAAAALAGNLGNLAGQLGLTDSAGADLSKSVIGLAADLGSFHNLDTADVTERIQKAMLGEYDSIKQLAPALNAAAVEQQALADTGKTSADQLTAQDKALATYALLVSQSSDAIGDLDRTSDSAANKQKNLNSQMEDAQTQLGQKLLPAWNGLLTFVLDEAIPGLQSLADWFAREVPPWYEEHVKPTVDAIVEVVRVAVDLLTRFWRTFGDTILKQLTTTFNGIMAVIGGAMKVIRGLIDVVLGILTGDWSRAWNGLKGIVSGVFQIVKGYVSVFIGYIKTPFRILGTILSGPWHAMQDAAIAVFNAIARAWNTTVGKLEFKAPSWVPGIGGKGFEVPDIPTVGARMAGVTVVMPEGSSGYSMVTTLRQYERAGGSTNLGKVAIA